MIGRKPEELIGKHFGTLFSRNNPAAIAEAIGTKGLESAGWHGDCILRRRDETDFTIFLSVGPIKNKEGRVTGMFGIARDISERKKAEDSLRASEEQFRQLADNIREVFFVLTPEPVRVTYVSPAYEEIWGRSRKEVYERPAAWIESVHPEDREGVGSFFVRLMQGIQSEMAYRILRPDGSVRYIEARSFPVRDSEDKLIWIVGIAEDTTVRREKENALKETHEKLNVALEESKKQTQDAARLSELVDILQSCQNAEEAYTITANALNGMLRSAAGALYITSPSRDVVEMVASWGNVLDTEKAFRPDSCSLRRCRKASRTKRCWWIVMPSSNSSSKSWIFWARS
jgi:PAS domain S-box-containing protein